MSREESQTRHTLAQKLKAGNVQTTRHTFSDERSITTYVDETPILTAIRKGEVALVKQHYTGTMKAETISANIHISDRLEITLTPLAYSILCNQVDIADYLIGKTKQSKNNLQGIAYSITDRTTSNNDDAPPTIDEGSILYAAITCLHHGEPNMLCITKLIDANATLNHNEHQLVIKSILTTAQTSFQLSHRLLHLLIDKKIIDTKTKYNGKSLTEYAIQYQQFGILSDKINHDNTTQQNNLAKTHKLVTSGLFQPHQPRYEQIQAIAASMVPKQKQQQDTTPSLKSGAYPPPSQPSSPPTRATISTPSPKACATSPPPISFPPSTEHNTDDTASNNCCSTYLNPLGTLYALFGSSAGYRTITDEKKQKEQYKREFTSIYGT